MTFMGKSRRLICVALCALALAGAGSCAVMSAFPRTYEAIDLIRREACSGLTAARVLGRFPCSRRQAEMRFRKATGHSVLDEIHDVQLARAKDLLREGTMPLKAISDFCGFENPNSLRKFFKAQTGRTMSEWRSGNLS